MSSRTGKLASVVLVLVKPIFIVAAACMFRDQDRPKQRLSENCWQKEEVECEGVTQHDRDNPGDVHGQLQTGRNGDLPSRILRNELIRGGLAGREAGEHQRAIQPEGDAADFQQVLRNCLWFRRHQFRVTLRILM